MIEKSDRSAFDHASHALSAERISIRPPIQI
jgi:hypothetical protein